MTGAKVVVALSEAEQRVAAFIGSQRFAVARQGGVTNARVGSQSDADTDRLGFGAELAFCKLFNLYPDLTPEVKQGGADCFRLGQSINIKTTGYPAGRLLAFRRERELACDCYALMIEEWPRFTLIGFATAAELFAESSWVPSFKGGRFARTQDTLHATQYEPDGGPCEKL